MEGADQNGVLRTSSTFGPRVPKPPNQKRGIPPAHPNTNNPSLSQSRRFLRFSAQPLGFSHSRSMSQPSISFLDSLPPSPFVSLNRGHALQAGLSLPPLKGHMRSSSDSLLKISDSVQSPPFVQLIGESSSFEMPDQLVQNGLVKDCDLDDKNLNGSNEDVFSQYINMDNISNLNFSSLNDKELLNQAMTIANGKASGEASSNCSEEIRGGVKRSSNGNIAPCETHKNLVKFMNVEFNAEEQKKIMESDKLAMITSTSPKRLKRILANRQSASRSKEKKRQYITDLEHKVKILQTEITTLSTKFTKIQGDNFELESVNNQYKLMIQAMEQQCRLKDALNTTLDAEVQYLRCTFAELGGESLTNCMGQQMFQQIKGNEVNPEICPNSM